MYLYIKFFHHVCIYATLLFCYERVKKNPGHYGFDSNLTSEQVDVKTMELCIR